VAPPRGGAAEPDQARCLGGNAVRRHELLLLAERAEEAERVDAKPKHADEAQREQTDGGGDDHAGPLAHAAPRSRAPPAEHEERQHDPGAQLHSDTRDERGRGRARARRGPGGEGQRAGEREQQQRVVVGAAHGEHQQHGVQSEERGGRRGRSAEAGGGASAQRNGAEAGGGGEALEQPQPAGEPQRRREIAREREQRPVGRVLEGPADEREDRIRGSFGGDVRVGVETVQRPHPREGEIAEDVLREQRRPQHEDDVREHDRGPERERRQRARADEDEQVAAAHDQHQELKGAAAEPFAEIRQRTRQPRGPAADAAGHVLRGSGGGARVEQENRHEHAGQANAPEGAHHRRRAARRLPPGRPGRCAFYARPGYGSRGLDDAHCYVCPSCKCPA
jgi:hypothetical protein